MQFFALAIFLVMSVILVMIPSATAEDRDVSITDDMKFNPEDLTINVEDTSESIHSLTSRYLFSARCIFKRLFYRFPFNSIWS